jgi:hypothetical protein
VLTVRDVEMNVASARLDSPLFRDSPPRDNAVPLFADWTNHVRLPLGTAVCPAPGGESTIVLTLVADGHSVEERLQMDDAVLRKISADECAQQAILDVATPSFGPVGSQDAAELHTVIVLTRGDAMSDAPVALTSMTGNIVFNVALSETAPRVVEPGADDLAVPAVVTVARCDPHVFAESKKTFVFPVRVTVGDAEAAYVEIRPDATAQAALQELFNSCGAAAN